MIRLFKIWTILIYQIYAKLLRKRVKLMNLKKVKKEQTNLLKLFFPISKNNQKNTSPTDAILFNIRYILENKTDVCSPDDLKLSINNNFLFDKLYENDKFELILDYQKFNANCHKINSLLAKDGYFLRIFELKQKFRYLSLKNPKKQTVLQQLSSCLMKNIMVFS